MKPALARRERSNLWIGAACHRGPARHLPGLREPLTATGQLVCQARRVDAAFDAQNDVECNAAQPPPASATNNLLPSRREVGR
jgi:hypothetical protein